VTHKLPLYRQAILNHFNKGFNRFVGSQSTEIMLSNVQQFTAAQVRRSFRKFNDYGKDLANSNSGTLVDTLNRFLDFCENDIVFTQIYNSLSLIGNNDDFEKWWQSICRTEVLEFPTDEERRIFIMCYLLEAARKDDPTQFIALGISHKFSLSQSSFVDDLIGAFHNTVTRPLVRDLNYKLEDMLDNVPENDKEFVPSSVFNLFNITAHKAVVQNVQGNNNTQTANIENNSELESEFNKLEQLLKDHLPSSEQEDSLTQLNSAKDAALVTKDPSKAISLLNTLKKLITYIPAAVLGSDNVVTHIDHIKTLISNLM
jgi:hypothetical protein